MIKPGTVLQERYEVEKPIGQGGMGSVYLARDKKFGTRVAVKNAVCDNNPLRRAFEHEARLLNSLSHPSLPKVSDHFSEGDNKYIVMDFIEGLDLLEMLEQRGASFEVEHVLDWTKQLCETIGYLHENGVVHRDIKPQNLKLTPDGRLILLDFGLAKGNPALMSNLTATKSVIGYSRNYAPIEQIEGAGTDHRSDIYSLGATVFHLVTGQPAEDSLVRAVAVLKGQRDPVGKPSDFAGSVPVSFDEAISSALSLNADERPESADALLKAIDGEKIQRVATPPAYVSTAKASAHTSREDAVTKIITDAREGEVMTVLKLTNNGLLGRYLAGTASAVAAVVLFVLAYSAVIAPKPVSQLTDSFENVGPKNEKISEPASQENQADVPAAVKARNVRADTPGISQDRESNSAKPAPESAPEIVDGATVSIHESIRVQDSMVATDLSLQPVDSVDKTPVMATLAVPKQTSETNPVEKKNKPHKLSREAGIFTTRYPPKVRSPIGGSRPRAGRRGGARGGRPR